MNYARFLNAISAARKVSPIRRLTEILAAAGPTALSFGGGMPNPGQFPFESIEIKLKADALAGESPIILQNATLNTALQYCPTAGLPELVAFLKDLQLRLHNPPTARRRPEERMELVITPGSQDGLCKIFEMVLSPGDSILLEEPNYPGTLAALRALGVRFLALRSDADGLIPESLVEALRPWPEATNLEDERGRPKLLYLQPNGTNPCGVSTSFERRQAIYAIAKAYDLLIVEDDPYYFLNFSEDVPASFLSLDTDGRVLRLDSFSKILSSGIRFGLVTGPKPLVDRVMLHLQVSSMHCSALSQVLVLELVKRWGVDGFLAHTRRVAQFYEAQCKHMLAACETHLTGLAEWYAPRGGMFLWLRAIGIDDTSRLINEKAVHKKVILAPGNVFMLDDMAPSPFMRAAFSNATSEQMNEGFRRLAELLREEQQLQAKAK